MGKKISSCSGLKNKCHNAVYKISINIMFPKNTKNFATQLKEMSYSSSKQITFNNMSNN